MRKLLNFLSLILLSVMLIGCTDRGTIVDASYLCDVQVIKVNNDAKDTVWYLNVSRVTHSYEDLDIGRKHTLSLYGPGYSNEVAQFVWTENWTYSNYIYQVHPISPIRISKTRLPDRFPDTVIAVRTIIVPESGGGHMDIINRAFRSKEKK